MLKIKKYFNAALILCACLVLQSCSSYTYWFMVTNTQSGNLCVEGFELDVTDPYALKVSKILYARYGEKEGEKRMYSGSEGGKATACENIPEYKAPMPNLIISVDFYKEVIEPEYLGTAPKPGTNTNL
jgi:hypothetical protein